MGAFVFLLPLEPYLFHPVSIKLFINCFLIAVIKEAALKNSLLATVGPYNTLMQVQTQFKLTNEHVKQRLTSMIDFRLQQLKVQQANTHMLVLNEALLEEWYELLVKMVYLRELKRVPTRATKLKTPATEKALLHVKPTLPLAFPSSNILLHADTNYLDLYHIQPRQERQPTFKSSITKLQFKKGFIHRFCSYHVLAENQILFIGGCGDKKLKSRDIFRFNAKTTQIAKICEMPYGVSSHGSVKIDNKIYIVGGNRDPNMVTTKCLAFDISLNTCEAIDELHYPSASHSVLAWKDRYVYKFGGIGSCFGEWDLSPYIERYSLAQNSWEIVNPIIKINENLIKHYSLLVNSLAYVSCQSSIVVLGGFDMRQECSRKIFEIIVREQTIGGQIQTVHQIIKFGEMLALEAGGFLPQQPLFLNGSILALQTQGVERKVAEIADEVHYL